MPTTCKLVWELEAVVRVGTWTIVRLDMDLSSGLSNRWDSPKRSRDGCQMLILRAVAWDWHVETLGGKALARIIGAAQGHSACWLPRREGDQ